MTRVYTDLCFLDHETGRHPEQPLRLVRIGTHLDDAGSLEKCELGSCEEASLEQLQRVHDADYITSVQAFANSGGGQIESDTVVSPASFDVARRASGAVCDAVEQVVAKGEQNALCLVRPPGHHAVEQSAMGFCLFNNIAVGGRHAINAFELDRVLIVDWDVHHGNGTQDAFWADEQVGFYSAHRWPFYPGSGEARETGTGAGLGATMNLPLEYGTPRSDYLKAFRATLEGFANRIKPQLVLISAGFDAHRLDPVGSLGLEVEDFATLTRIVLDVAEQHCGGRIVSVLEGGYNVDVLPLCVATHLNELVACGGEKND